jgi:hypothetical protein
VADKKPYDQPSEVSVDDDAVKIKGPDSVDVTLTPEAALETSDRLFGEAMKARGGRTSKAKEAASQNLGRAEGVRDFKSLK